MYYDLHVTVAVNLQFTFASNAATILGGCLVTNTYKLRVPAVFVSAFIISVSYIDMNLLCIHMYV